MGEPEVKPELTFEEKVKLFIGYYNSGESGRQAAIKAGWSVPRAHKTACELLKRPEILSQIKKLNELERTELTSGEDSIRTILEDNLPEVLKRLIDKPDKFVAAYKNLHDLKKEELGEFDGYSIREILEVARQEIKTLQDLVERVEIEIREGKVQ